MVAKAAREESHPDPAPEPSGERAPSARGRSRAPSQGEAPDREARTVKLAGAEARAKATRTARRRGTPGMTLHAIAEPNWQLMAIAMAIGMLLAGVATLALPDLASGLMALVAVAITGLTPYAAKFERARLHSPSQRSLLAAVLIGLPMLTFGAALAHWTATSAAEWENSIGILVIVSSLSSIILNRQISSVVIAMVRLARSSPSIAFSSMSAVGTAE